MRMNTAKLRSTIAGVQKRAILGRAITRFAYGGGKKTSTCGVEDGMAIWSVDGEKRRDKTN